MARSLSYSDAVRLLGGQDSKVVAAIEKITGGVLLAATPAVPALLGLFDAKAELVRLSHDLVRGFADRRSGLSRYSRTERLEAAHLVIVVAAFFEAMADSDLPIEFRDLEITKAEQLAVTGAGNPPGAVADDARIFAHLVGNTMVPPLPHQSAEVFRIFLRDYYEAAATVTQRFVAGLAVWDRLGAGERDRFSEALRALPDRAVTRYDELFRQLVADFPEVACWASQREHRATRTALAGLQETLEAISTGRAPDQRRASLALAYRAELDRQIVESGDVPDGIRVPELGEGYVPPRFRVCQVPSAAQVSEESWWSRLPARDDLQEFLIGHLTAPQAVRAPLLVLGQPGSGKSVLTRILAARLPAADFLPIRVVLRDTPALDEIQDQIEYAVRQATGERVEWPGLARSAGDAMPVILLDGFDELLQAVGVSQTDYLVRVARFQRREADQGRPVAVIVTSRTAVADRARTPEETTALRLEPFDDERVALWLDIWNRVNAANFAAAGLRPLAPEVVLQHRDLTGQPLLLLMLALYDADRNALQRAGSDLRATELYEQLLRSFALREIGKHRPGLPDREVRAAVENELRRLSVVAFAMFNRSVQWVTEADLDRDLAALQICGPAGPGAAAGMRAALPEAELTLGRFFFIHRARALPDETAFPTYEFLHATFGEYLVARLTWQVLTDLAARDAASSMSFNAGPAEDDLMRALLSFQPLSARGPILDFLDQMAGTADADRRQSLRELLVRLYRAVNHTPPGIRYADYRPQSPSEPARYATYAANLLLLALCCDRLVLGSELYPAPPDPVDDWHSQTLLWRALLTVDGWTSLVAAIGLSRVEVDGRRDLRLSLHGFTEVTFEPEWIFEEHGDALLMPDLSLDQIRQKAYFQCSVLDDMVHHAVQPLNKVPASLVNSFVRVGRAEMASAAHLLVDFWANPSAGTAQRVADLLTAGLPWSGTTYRYVLSALLDRLRAGRTVSPEAAGKIFQQLVEAPAMADAGAQQTLSEWARRELSLTEEDIRRLE
ncbi:hypothetical protein BJY16_004080 [Actinoplanes octamycinicus]|uniref:AAA+ ATPase domain-containing protein n=1 Tax=Actinoplanes octamycinicus TaxID=135948 RepID=A0A7W7GYF7_9ACTN|nr:hypothetical protein [Actinoplanes octamycinicus]MBB4740621.1 hypothetical protein [Actinoplanes octamycinicus]